MVPRAPRLEGRGRGRARARGRGEAATFLALENEAIHMAVHTMPFV